MQIDKIKSFLLIINKSIIATYLCCTERSCKCRRKEGWGEEEVGYAWGDNTKQGSMHTENKKTWI